MVTHGEEFEESGARFVRELVPVGRAGIPTEVFRVLGDDAGGSERGKEMDEPC